jgi:hypothetical protein
MSTLPAIALGAMMVCTPSLVFLAWLLWKALSIRSYDEDASSHPTGDRRFPAEILSRWLDVTGKAVDPSVRPPQKSIGGEFSRPPELLGRADRG